jgi:hypothetical protein
VAEVHPARQYGLQSPGVNVNPILLSFLVVKTKR